MRLNDFRMRDTMTITADGTVDERIISVIEPRTGGLPAANNKNHGIDFATYLNFGARPPLTRSIDPRNSDPMPAEKGQ